MTLNVGIWPTFKWGFGLDVRTSLMRLVLVFPAGRVHRRQHSINKQLNPTQHQNEEPLIEHGNSRRRRRKGAHHQTHECGPLRLGMPTRYSDTAFVIRSDTERLQIRRYLEAFKKKSFYNVRNARMTDITLDDMKFDCGGQEHVIAFDPPLKSFREARERVVQVDKEALRALYRSDVTITTYIPPTANLFHLYNFTQCLLTYLAFSRAANFQPGSLLYDNVLSGLPGVASSCLAIQPFLFPGLIFIHAIETGIMIAKLDRHGLSPLKGAWWGWAGSAFVEGVTSMWRIDGLIERTRKVKEAKKH